MSLCLRPTLGCSRLRGIVAGNQVVSRPLDCIPAGPPNYVDCKAVDNAVGCGRQDWQHRPFAILGLLVFFAPSSLLPYLLACFHFRF